MFQTTYRRMIIIIIIIVCESPYTRKTAETVFARAAAGDRLAYDFHFCTVNTHVSYFAVFPRDTFGSDGDAQEEGVYYNERFTRPHDGNRRREYSAVETDC